MLYTGDFVLRYYVRFSQIRSHILKKNIYTYIYIYIYILWTLDTVHKSICYTYVKCTSAGWYQKINDDGKILI